MRIDVIAKRTVRLKEIAKMKITILYDNAALRGFHAGHGFACLVEGKRTILFDTGWDGYLLIANMVRLGITPARIDAVMLSHSHWDHIGGLPTLLSHNKRLNVFYPRWFSRKLKREVSARAHVQEIAGAAQLADGMYTTGELGSEVKEQSLIITCDRGSVVITGCAHPGLATILHHAKQYGRIHGVIGGFHDFDDYPLLQGIPLIVPCHCTRHTRELQKRYPDRCKPGCAGKIIRL